MVMRRIGRTALCVAVLFVAGCNQQPTVAPPFSDLQLQQLSGKIQQVNAKVYVIERSADMAAALSTPDSWLPPADLPARTADGDAARTEQEMHFDHAGNLLSSRFIIPASDAKSMHAEALISVSQQAPGLRSVQCAMTMGGSGSEHRFGCGSGEWRYLSPGISRRELKSATSDTSWEEQYDARGRMTISDHRIVNKDEVAGKAPRDFTEHKVAQAYDAQGRVTASRGTRNGEDRYNYVLYLAPDRLGNPQRMLLLSSTSADRRDLASLKRVELLIITYTYYDEIR